MIAKRGDATRKQRASHRHTTRLDHRQITCSLTASYLLANRLVGNAAGTAVLEVTLGGLHLRANDELTVVTTGARCAGSSPHNAPGRLRAGDELLLGAPAAGLRTYVAVRGGFAVEPVLRSCSTDLLAGLGPAVVATGDMLEVGEPGAPMARIDVAPVSDLAQGDVTVRVLPGPRRDWFCDGAWISLVSQSHTVSSDSNRVGIRLAGEPLERIWAGELQSEGMARGALQIPPAGTPVLFLADHPVTGGYPVIAYVVDDDVDRCAQLQPGQTLLLREVMNGGGRQN